MPLIVFHLLNSIFKRQIPNKMFVFFLSLFKFKKLQYKNKRKKNPIQSTAKMANENINKFWKIICRGGGNIKLLTYKLVLDWWWFHQHFIFTSYLIHISVYFFNTIFRANFLHFVKVSYRLCFIEIFSFPPSSSS